MSTTDRWTDRLSEYLDGELGPEERDALEAHLDGCSTCAATLAELRAVSDAARTLPAHELRADVHADLWAGIAPRLAPRRVPLGERLRAFFQPRDGRFTLTIPQLAAAAVALVIVSAGVTFCGSNFVARRTAGPLVAQQQPRGDTTGATAATGATASVASFDEARYASAVADLERTLDERRGELDPATVRALEDNLALIDEAVAEAKRALIADPSNPYLSGHLASQMHRKVRVLQRAAMIVAANP